MNSDRSTGKKLREWVRRYLPCEVAGTTCEMSGAAIAYSVTGSAAMAAVVATIGASVGYYAAAYVAAVRNALRADPSSHRMSRALNANGRALRSVAIEFGPAEVIDSLIIRPLAFYVGPILFGGMVAGWIFAKLVADVGFYLLAIFSYERFSGLLVVRPRSLEVSHEPAASVAAA
ncbi:hypothetical protein [Mycolicibacterium hodleri]|uniref:Uncharacterized protein n=1 Tax=Mycolicibacterium hodleri TaxID=49897 RepID=A0A502EHA0_9MYCO|nr:hypothetical protein [Mycolicibacterium hodleri]TPG35711.1 hypothetical protein EAH80_06475 [Mycolicibacterium hodleri]